MRASSLVALVLAAAIAAPASAEHHFTASETSALASGVIVASPFLLSYFGGKKLSEAGSGDMGKQKRWRVAAVQPQGDKTAIALRSEDQTMKIDTMVASKIARSQGLKVEDELGLEAIGKSGFVLRKGETTIGVLTQPENGLVHSKARG